MPAIRPRSPHRHVSNTTTTAVAPTDAAATETRTVAWGVTGNPSANGGYRRRRSSVIAMRRTNVAAAVAAVLILGTAPAGAAPSDTAPPFWIGSYAAAQGFVNRAPLAGSTVRVIVDPHVSGNTVRLRFGNHLGAHPVDIRAVHLGVSPDGSPNVKAGSNVPVTFSGSEAAVIPAGGEVISDPVRLDIVAFQPLAVSIFIARADGISEHFDAHQLSWLSPGVDAGRDAGGERFTTPYPFVPLLTGVDVAGPATGRTVVAFGDSVTDGYHNLPMQLATLGTDQRYPDFLARRIAETGRSDVGIVNAGISGNQVTRSANQSESVLGFGPSGIERFARDALGAPNVSDVIVLAGSNDLSSKNHTPATAEAVIAGLQEMIATAHNAGVRVHLGTILPRTDDGAPTPEAIAAVNQWILSQRESDSVIDFAAALRDPLDPTRLSPHFDSGDGVHPNPAGYRAMSDAVDLDRLLNP